MRTRCHAVRGLHDDVPRGGACLQHPMRQYAAYLGNQLIVDGFRLPHFDADKTYARTFELGVLAKDLSELRRRFVLQPGIQRLCVTPGWQRRYNKQHKASAPPHDEPLQTG